MRLIDSIFLRREFFFLYSGALIWFVLCRVGTLKRIVSLSRVPLAPTTRWTATAAPTLAVNSNFI
jgi:hypothetical protein